MFSPFSPVLNSSFWLVEPLIQRGEQVPVCRWWFTIGHMDCWAVKRFWQSGDHWNEQCKLKQGQEELEPTFRTVGPKKQLVLISPGTVLLKTSLPKQLSFLQGTGETAILAFKEIELSIQNSGEISQRLTFFVWFNLNISTSIAKHLPYSFLFSLWF
jgi:hypothetical protein